MAVITEQESNIIITKFNSNKYNYGNNQFYHEEFNKVAQKYPNKNAIVFEGQEFTYSEINKMSNSLAHYLRNNGVKRNNIIPILCERSYYYIISSIAIMKAGGAFLYIDPEVPKERIQFMIKETKSNLVLTYLPNQNFETILESDSEVKEYDISHHNFSEDTEEINNINISSDICCVFFTSGTTGKPKCSLISHDNFISGCQYSLSKDNGKKEIYEKEYENVLSFLKESYIFSILDTFYPLLKSKKLIYCNKEEYNEPELIGNLIEKYSVDHICSTPSRINNYLNNETFRKAVNKVKQFLFGGEKATVEFFQYLSQYSNASIYYGYGLTETTAACIIGRISQEDINKGYTLSIGLPLCNFEIYILNEELEMVPIGEEGEIYVWGYGVSPGYLNQEELTNERFIDCPFHQDSNSLYKKMYKTGDIGKWTEDGRVICLGRNDSQIKIRGQRIELGEIENTIKEIEGINYSVVVCKTKETGEKYLVGYYMIGNDSNSKCISSKTIQNYLTTKLPNHMIPSYFKCIDSLPMNNNGKLDRSKLPEISIKDIIEEEYEEPVTDTEKTISTIYHQVFCEDMEEKIGKNANFYELGGDSLNAVKIVSKIKQIYNINIKISEVMKYSTVGSLASFVDIIIKNHDHIYYKESIRKYHCNDDFPLMCISMRSISLQLFKIYIPDHMIQYYSISESIDLDRLTKAFRKIIERQELLQVAYYEKIIDGVPKVYCKKIDHDEFVIEHYKFENYKDFIRPYDISKDCLLRVGIIENKVMMVDLSHKVGDGFSIGVINRELDKLYHGQELEELPIQISDCSIYYEKIYNNVDFTDSINYYRTMFNGNYEVIKLPKKILETETQEKSKKTSLRIFKSLKRYPDRAVQDVINRISCKYNLSKTAILFTVYCLVLSLYSNQKVINSGIINSNRSLVYTERLIGLFVRTLPISINIESKNLIEIIKVTMEKLLTIFSSDVQDFMIKEQLKIPQFNTFFKFDPYSLYNCDKDDFIKTISESDFFKIFNREDLIKNKKTKPFGTPYDFYMNISERKDCYEISFSYDENLYEEQLMNEIMDKFIWIIKDEANFTKNINEFSMDNGSSLTLTNNDISDEEEENRNIQEKEFEKSNEIIQINNNIEKENKIEKLNKEEDESNTF